MKTVRKSLLRGLVIRFSVLAFFLLALLCEVWFFLLWENAAGISGAETFAPLFKTGLFIFVVVIVLLVVAVLLGLIFIYPLSERLRELISQLSEFKSASRLTVSKNDELSDVAVAVNKVIDRLEGEISEGRLAVAGEHKHFIEEQDLLAVEQKRMYEEKEKLEYVLSRITDGVIMLGRNRNIVMMNKAAEEITGFNQKEAGTKLLAGLIKFYEKSDEILMDEYAPTIQTNTSQDASFIKKRVRLESRYATPKLVNIVCVQLKLIHTQDLGYMIVLHDLSEELDIEKKQIGLLASFAHELKQPLLMMSNERVQAGVIQLSLVLENLQTCESIDNGTLVVNSQAVDLLVLLRKSIADVKELALERQVTLQFDEPKDFPGVVLGDALKINQIVLNLLLNAIYYSAGGSVSITLSQSERDIIMQIQDSGIGIPTEATHDLFTKFFVIPSTNQNSESGEAVQSGDAAATNRRMKAGIGLGLYVCKKLVELQNGKIWLDSVEGRGTVVSVSLPKGK